MNRHAIVLVTYNRLALLKKCIDAIQNQTLPYDCIVIVDNGCTDGTTEYLKQFETGEAEKRFIIIHTGENLGGAGGFERGLYVGYHTGADWVTIIDDDAILRNDFLEKIDEAIEQKPSYQCFAGVPLTDGIRRGHRRRVTDTWIKREKPVELSEYEGEGFECEIASFCGMVVKGELIFKIDLPKRDYFIWYDDTEWSLRISKHTKIWNVNAAVIDHEAPIPAENPALVTWKDYYGIRNRINMARKHYGKPTMYAIILKKWIKGKQDANKLWKRGMKKECKYLQELYHDALMDGYEDRLGINNKYLPGK